MCRKGSTRRAMLNPTSPEKMPRLSELGPGQLSTNGVALGAVVLHCQQFLSWIPRIPRDAYPCPDNFPLGGLWSSYEVVTAVCREVINCRGVLTVSDPRVASADGRSSLKHGIPPVSAQMNVARTRGLRRRLQNGCSRRAKHLGSLLGIIYGTAAPRTLILAALV